MGLFGFGKEKDKQEKCCCCCDPQKVSEMEADKKGAGIKVLGSGCSKCNALEESVREAMAALGIAEDIEHVTDFSKIAAYGVMTTPALVVDGKVVSAGRVLSKDEAAEIIKKQRG